MPEALISLGSNLGDSQATLTSAVAALRQTTAVRVVDVSRFIATQPVGGPPDQPAFLNGALRIETTLPPLALLRELQNIEQQAGRVRTVRWGARTLDLDLLLYGNQILREPELQLPHPGLMFRRFVLQPVAEIAGELSHPELGWSLAKLHQHLDQSTPWLVIVGFSAEVRARFIAELQTAAAVRLTPMSGASVVAQRSLPAEATSRVDWTVSSLSTAAEWQPTWPSPRLTFVLAPAAAKILWGPSLVLPDHKLSEAVVLAAAAISAMLPFRSIAE